MVDVHGRNFRVYKEQQLELWKKLGQTLKIFRMNILRT